MTPAKSGSTGVMTMADKRLTVECTYCGAKYALRFKQDEEETSPEFCCFCGESFESIKKDDEDEELEDDYEETESDYEG